MKPATSDCLMVDVGRNDAVTRDKHVAVVVGDVDSGTAGVSPSSWATNVRPVPWSVNKIDRRKLAACSRSTAACFPKVCQQVKNSRPTSLSPSTQKSAEIKRGSTIGDIIIRRTIDMVVVVYCFLGPVAADGRFTRAVAHSLWRHIGKESRIVRPGFGLQDWLPTMV